jgi:hypothetical protein
MDPLPCPKIDARSPLVISKYFSEWSGRGSSRVRPALYEINFLVFIKVNDAS